MVLIRGFVPFLRIVSAARVSAALSFIATTTQRFLTCSSHSAGLKNRFEEYPKLRELIRLKDKLIADTGNTPMYLKADISSFKLADLQTKFDVILIEPPLEEYNRMNGAVYDKYWSWPEVRRCGCLPVAVV